ncbi:MAG: D-glucuronyl C5-epimerase family protein [Candidatus Aminicenantales bacterium]
MNRSTIPVLCGLSLWLLTSAGTDRCQARGKSLLKNYCLNFESGRFYQVQKGFYKSLNSVEIHPVEAAGYALDNYQKYLNTGSGAFKSEFLDTADSLLAAMVLRNSDDRSKIGLWFYNFDWDYLGTTIPKPWLSGMAQGMILSVMMRAYDLTQEPKYREAMTCAFNSLVKPSSVRNLIVSETATEYWIEEYPPVHILNHELMSSSVLNGGLIGVYGLLEYFQYTRSDLRGVIEPKILNFLRRNIARYDIPGVSPAYSLLRCEVFNSILNFETDVDAPSEVLPLYEIRISSDRGRLLRVIRSTGGSAGYPYAEFRQGDKLDFFFSTDEKHPEAKIPVEYLRLITSSGEVVMAMEMNGKAFYNAWSPAYEMSGKWVRDYLLTGDGYSDSDKIGRFIMELPRSVPPDQYLFLEVKYQDTNAFSVPVFIGSPNKIDVGFLKNSGSQEWKIEQFYIPRSGDFAHYNLYLNFLAVKSYDGRRAQSLDFRKKAEAWSGNWLKWRVDDFMIPEFRDSKDVVFDVTYKDTSSRTVFFNVFNGANYALGILRNVADGRWKTDRFIVPSKYFLYEGSHAEKTTMALQALTAVQNLLKVNDFQPWLETWKDSVYTKDKHTFVVYAKNNKKIELPVRFKLIQGGAAVTFPRSEEWFSVPNASLQNWKNGPLGFRVLTLNPYEYAYIHLPHRSLSPDEKTITRLEMTYRDDPKDETLYVGIRDLIKTQLFEIGEISLTGTGADKTAVFEIDRRYIY